MSMMPKELQNEILVLGDSGYIGSKINEALNRTAKDAVRDALKIWKKV